MHDALPSFSTGGKGWACLFPTLPDYEGQNQWIVANVEAKVGPSATVVCLRVL